MFFFVKQKTAYEMRISDWSSDVCSSDLLFDRRGQRRHGGGYGRLLRPARNIPEIFLHQRARGLGIDVARQHQHGVVGAVMGAEPAPHILKAGGVQIGHGADGGMTRSEEHPSELQSLMRISYAVFCL